MPFGPLDQPLPAVGRLIGTIPAGQSSFADIAIPNLAQPMTKLRLVSGMFAAAVEYTSPLANAEIAVIAQLMVSGAPRWTGRVLTNVADVTAGNVFGVNIASPIDLINSIDVRSGQDLRVRCQIFNYSPQDMTNVGVGLGQQILSLGSTAPAYQSSGDGGNVGALTVVVSKPAGTVQGDLMLAYIAVQDTIAAITPPAGWAFVDYATVAGVVGVLYQKTAGAAEPASYTWTFNVAANAAGVIDRFTGLDPSAPVNGSNSSGTGSGGSVTTGNLTTTAPCLIAEYVASAGGQTFPAWTPPAGTVINDTRAGGNAPNAISVASAHDVAPQGAAGPTGGRTFTFNANQNQTSAIVGLAPQTGSVTTSPVNSGLTYQELRWNE